MAYRERQKISQMTPKGSDLELTDLLEVSTIENGSYVTKSITGQEIINAATGGALDLQAVTDNGNTTTNALNSVDGIGNYGITAPNNLTTGNYTSNTIAYLNNDGTLGLGNGSVESKLKNTNVTNPDVILEFPDKPTGSYTIATTGDLTSGTVTSVDLTMPSAFSVSGNPITTSGTLAVTGAGTVSQYVRGDGSLANFPTVSGGGASTSYYLNGSVNQGTIGGVTYYEMNKTPILGTGTNFSRNTNGYIASFLTDANDPGLLKIPGGNWNLEIYFSASSGGGTPTFYVELYKYDGSTFSLIASSSTNPEAITGGTVTDAYFTNLSVPETILTATDRLAFRIHVTTVGRTITLHTEDNNLCQIITTFTTGLTALNGLTDQVQNFATGTSGTDFGITSSSATHTFNLPIASATNTGKLSSTDWNTFNGKQAALVSGTNIKTIEGQSILGSGNIDLTKSDVGLGNVDNTSDLNKPISTATQTALNSKQDSLISGTNIKTINSNSILGSGNISVGTITSVTGTAPIASSGGTTPAISISQATTSTDGYLSSTDWNTFNNKASYTPRVQSVTSSATVTPAFGNDLVKITAQATGLTLANPTGTWDEGKDLIIRIKDNGTARSITYGAKYRAIGVTLPTTTVINKTTYLGLIYNQTDDTFDVIGVTTQA